MTLEGAISAFPEGYAPRQVQKDILAEIDERLASGYKRIILSAPTGVGKSLVAASLARSCGSSFLVTATKHLQDQYSRDLGFLKPAKGKRNFECRQLMQEQNVRAYHRAIRNGLTCEKGACIRKVQKNGKTTEEVCKFKPKIADVAAGKIDLDACAYYKQKYEALTSDHSVWNYAMYFQAMRTKKSFGEYMDKKSAVYDEAHRIEDQIIQFIGIDIGRRTMEECGLDPGSYDMTDIDSMISLEDDIAEKYARILKDLESSRGQPDLEALSRTETMYKVAARARADMVENKENFVIGEPEQDDRGFRSVSIKPVGISRYVREFFQAGIQMFMSATIEKAGFCENTGIDPEGVAVVDVPSSPFPAESRKVTFENVCWLSGRSPDSDRAALFARIGQIMDKHEGERGLILTSSVSWCHQILGALSPANKARIRICHSKNPEGRTQEDIIDEHAGTPGSVLLSSSLWEGVDLKGDMSRFQVIAKAPFASLGDRRVAAKKRLFPRWYTGQARTKLLQGLGRSVRAEDDWAVTYVLDTAAQNLLEKSRPDVPRAYHDVLGWGQA